MSAPTSSDGADGGKSAARRIRKPPLRTNGGPAYTTKLRPVASVGRNSAHHYDPVTGRKLPRS